LPDQPGTGSFGTNRPVSLPVSKHIRKRLRSHFLQNVPDRLLTGTPQPSPRHRHRHQEIRCHSQPHVLAALQVKLAWLLPTLAQGKESVPPQKPDRADYPVGLHSLGVGVVELDNQIVGLMHGSVDQVTHFACLLC
jgi:hypothetical protein